MNDVRTTCPYCGVGCGVVVRTAGDGVDRHIVDVAGDPAHPANRGRLCSKGAMLHRTTEPLRQQQARIARPEWRDAVHGRAQRDGLDQGDARIRREGHDRHDACEPPRRPVAWDTALDALADRFADTIATYGPDAVGFYVSGQLLTEDYYVFNKLARGLVGTNHIDSNSRLCMSSAVVGHKLTLGADAPPACYEDIDQADCVFVVGSNTAWAHPVVFGRIEAARAARPARRLIVVDPRRTETAAAADLHLPILPGTDIALLQAMLHWMLWEGRVDRTFIDAHTEGFDALRSAVRECSPRWAAGVCGVDEAAIVRAADWFSASPATLSLWCQGINQSTHGSDANAMLIDLHLATGQIGRPGAGPLSLTGQPNAMGGREVGAMATLLPGHRDPACAEDRAAVARLWGVDALPATPGHTALDLFEAVGRGEVRLLWIACTNPLQSLPDASRVRAGLARAELVVVQEAFHGTETAAFADVLLPATTWGEKDGTVTTSEPRISRVRAALPPHGEARADWAIAADFARRLAVRLAARGVQEDRSALFAWPDAEAVWNEHRETTRGRDLDIGGLSWATLERDGPQQWPYPAGARHGTARLYGDGRFPTASGRARLHVAAHRPPAERVDARHPLTLITGRLRDQWHGMSRTGLVGQAFGHAPEPVLEMAAPDLARRGLHDGQLVRVTSRRGDLVLPVQASTTLRSGAAFIAMHWGGAFTAGDGVNTLTTAAADPRSHQPALKQAAVRVAAAALHHRLIAFGHLPAASVITVRGRLSRWMQRFPFASCVPFGRDPEGLRLRIAAEAPLPDDALAAITAAFEVDPATLLRYDDPRRGRSRRIALADGRLRFVLLVGDDASAGWLADWMAAGTPVDGVGRRLLIGGASPPTLDHAAAGLPTRRGRIVCNCEDVGEAEITRALAEPRPPGDPLQALQQRLACGTGCGACLPELRRMIAEAVVA